MALICERNMGDSRGGASWWIKPNRDAYSRTSMRGRDAMVGFGNHRQGKHESRHGQGDPEQTYVDNGGYQG
jgi:hypothetical protein